MDGRDEDDDEVSVAPKCGKNPSEFVTASRTRIKVESVASWDDA